MKLLDLKIWLKGVQLIMERKMMLSAILVIPYESDSWQKWLIEEFFGFIHFTNIFKDNFLVYYIIYFS